MNTMPMFSVPTAEDSVELTLRGQAGRFADGEWMEERLITGAHPVFIVRAIRCFAQRIGCEPSDVRCDRRPVAVEAEAEE